MNKRMDRRQQGRRQPGRMVDYSGLIPRGTVENHSQQALMRSHLAPLPLDHLSAYMELARQGALQGPAVRGPNIANFGSSIPLSIPVLSSGQGFYTVESLQGATSVPHGILPPQSHLVAPEGSRVMGFGTTGVRQGYDSGLGNMHMMMNPMLGHEMLANGHPHPGSPMVAITSRPQQGLLGHMFANGPTQHPHLPHVPLGFHPGRPSSGPGPMYGWPQERDHRQGWGWDRDGVRDMKSDWNHRHWDESRQVEKLHTHGRRGLVKRNEQPSPARQAPSNGGNEKKRKFPNALGPGGPGWCTLCELECNTGEMLQQHKQGKRHKRHLQKLDTYQQETKEKSNSSNSSVKVVTSEGDASSRPDTGPCVGMAMEDCTGADTKDKTKSDVDSGGQALNALSVQMGSMTEASPDLSVASEVEQSSNPACQVEEEGDVSKRHVMLKSESQEENEPTNISENPETDVAATSMSESRQQPRMVEGG